MKTKKQVVAAALCAVALSGGDVFAQSMAEDMARFRREKLASMREFVKERQTDMANYRDSINAQYADFLKKTWGSFNLLRQDRRFAPMPEPPVYDPHDSVPVADVPVPVVEVEPMPQPKPDPVTVAPDLPKPDLKPVPVVESAKMIPADFYGTRVQVSVAGGSCGHLSGVSEQAVADYWTALSAMPVSSWLADVQRLSDELQLDDWGVCQLMETLFKTYIPGGTENESVVFKVFMLNQLGYKAKIGRSQSDLLLLLATETNLANTSFFNITERNGMVRYYVINPHHRALSKVQTCASEYGNNGRLMNLAVNRLPNLSNDMETQQLTFENRTYQIDYNRNRVKYYESYPCVDFSIYASAPIDRATFGSLKEQLMPQIAGKSQEEAVNFLLHWVQSSFRYKTDDDQYGYEKWNFAEETIVSAYCDCDDRAVLFAQLVRNLLGMKVVLVYYTGVHLATAVHFDNPRTTGSNVEVDGEKYLICDPTYIGADIGMAMTNLGNTGVKILPLQAVEPQR